MHAQSDLQQKSYNDIYVGYMIHVGDALSPAFEFVFYLHYNKICQDTYVIQQSDRNMS